ncbi:FAD-dependent oxidoreductase [Mycolicibacterium sp. YH-1]|uniref:FAD-dependent oxidoreductase n=1 Tax=Mycolicibacterium sp. YH-1 TaxID=2908837 RepID=UPI001F4BCEE8|nr:FAD-dependent oxidoreductase [Mycolicibacterium sp. YH-1]UNB50091.1 FAD-binding oxidoreductase [Mycolicibacterium sp. YH-1]
MTTVLRAVVVGSGISGLTTAISLLEAGHSVRIVAAEPAMSTTSAVAAAVWFPTHVAPWERVSGWGEDTFGVLAEHAAAQVPGVIMRESLGLYREQPGEATWVGAVGGVRDARADELPPGYAYGLRYAVPLAEMPRYLPWLVARVRALGGQFTQRHLQSLDDVGHGADVVVNCAGLGASDLVGDASMYPVRGQIVRVRNPGLTVSVRDELHPGGRAYVHPRTADCILGGTLDVGQWDTAPDPAVGAAILARCTDLVPALRGAEVLEHVVGLRPGRPTVRLEEGERLRSGARVVHNYGHGGSGITLCWGCAREVTALVGQPPPPGGG